jgi:DeoR family transcriptional regulator, suf operon transcriptional repressor
MLKENGSRQVQLLKLLLYAKGGLSIETMAAKLKISRNAVKQHLLGLEQENLIKKHDLNFTGGRPARNYMITDQGINQFPKQYAWFSQLLMTGLKEEMGEAKFREYMAKMGEKLACRLRAQDLDSGSEKLTGLMDSMQALGYFVEVPACEKGTVIHAYNCVYHDLAQQFPELCEFDRAFMATWLDRPISQTQCMAQNDCVCEFRVKSN